MYSITTIRKKVETWLGRVFQRILTEKVFREKVTLIVPGLFCVLDGFMGKYSTEPDPMRRMVWFWGTYFLYVGILGLAIYILGWISQKLK